MADFGDGTFGIAWGNDFYRFDNRLVHDGNNNLRSAALGQENSIWVGILEKAIAQSASPASPRWWALASAGPDRLLNAFGATQVSNPIMGQYATSATNMGNKVAQAQRDGKVVILGLTASTTTVPGGHAYALEGVNRDAAGNVTSLRLYNPWGVDGSSNGYADGQPDDGLVTLGVDQIWSGAGTSRVVVADVNWG
jgi:hypothetical protein